MGLSGVAVVACICLLVFLLSSRPRADDSGALTRLALLHGVRKVWGESEQSLRNRSTAASRWPYGHPDPEFVWWARVCRRMIGVVRPG